jgi:hypothetical protein
MNIELLLSTLAWSRDAARRRGLFEEAEAFEDAMLLAVSAMQERAVAAEPTVRPTHQLVGASVC